MNKQPLKTCTLCGKIFPATLEHFYKVGGKKEGLRPTCKRCTIDRATQTRDPEKLREYGRQWGKDNREKRRQSCRDWRSRNLEQQRERERQVKQDDPNHAKRAREWEARNPKRHKEQRKRYRENNREKLLIKTHRYFSRKSKLPDDFAQDDWQYALDYFNGRCAVCERPPGFWHTLAMDHWVPMSATDCPGTIPSNIVPLCHGIGGCNNSKHNNDPQEWLIKKFGTKKARAISKRIQRYFSLVRQAD